jgi:hypothetical protein
MTSKESDVSADPYAELEAALMPLRAAQPGISMQEAALLLPEHLRHQLWERAIDRYLDSALAEVDAEPKRPTRVTTVATTLDAEVDR